MTTSHLSRFLAGLLVLAPSAALAGPVDDGQMAFKQTCSVCHTVEKDKRSTIGPNLNGVVGRKAGATDFSYSPALKASGLIWTSANLDKFLTDPNAAVPRTRMFIKVSDPARRKAIVAYLTSQK